MNPVFCGVNGNMTGRKTTSWEVPSWFAGIKGPADGDVHYPRIDGTMIGYAKALIAFLTSPAVKQAWTTGGFESR
jgi:hypothetical protein